MAPGPCRGSTAQDAGADRWRGDANNSWPLGSSLPPWARPRARVARGDALRHASRLGGALGRAAPGTWCVFAGARGSGASPLVQCVWAEPRDGVAPVCPCSATLQSSAARALLLAKGCKTPGKRLPRARNLSCEREGGREGGREERTDGRTDGRRDGGREIMVFLIGTCLVSSYSEQCPCCPATTSRTATPSCWAHAVVKAGCADPRGAKPLVRPKSSAGRCMPARRTSDAAAWAQREQ